MTLVEIEAEIDEVLRKKCESKYFSSDYLTYAAIRAYKALKPWLYGKERDFEAERIMSRVFLELMPYPKYTEVNWDLMHAHNRTKEKTDEGSS